MSLQRFARQQVVRPSIDKMAGERAVGIRLNTNLDVYLEDKYAINGTKYMDDIAFSKRMEGKGGKLTDHKALFRILGYKGKGGCGCPGMCMCGEMTD